MDQPNSNRKEASDTRQPQANLTDPPEETSHAAEFEPTVRQPREKPGVLVVDDEHMVRIMVQLGLERSGFDVLLARSGPEAIDLYRGHAEEIAVVLLDTCMPGLDGLDTLKVLRELNPDVLACFMSTESSAYEPEELVARGAAYVISKPFRLDDLASILTLLAHHVSTDLRPSGRACRR